MIGTKITGVIEERISKEGKPYLCMIIKLTDSYEKKVFFKSLELELLKTYINSNSNK